MNCASCSQENPDTNRFCGACGAALPRACPFCQHANPPEHRFCGGCGAMLGDSSQSTVERGGASRLSTLNSRLASGPASHTPHHLAEKILSSRSALEGERKQVTVLFADVEGSMELAEQFDLPGWMRRAQELRRRLSAVEAAR